MTQVEARIGAAAPSATIVTSHRMLRLRDWITGIGICALAIGLTAYQLGARPLWNDEAWTAWIGVWVADFHGLLNQIQVRAFNMSLYYAIIFVWVHFWRAHGVLATEWIVRLPSLVFAPLSAVAVWLIGRRFLGGFAGALGAVLYVCNIAQLDAAQQARSYPLLLLLVCLSWYALLVLVSSQSSQLWWVVYVVTNVLANYAHILNALDIMAQAAAFGLFLSLDTVWRARARALWKGMLLSLVVIGVLAIPLLWLMVHQDNQTNYLGSPHVSDLPHLFVGYVASSSSVARALVVLCVLVGLVAVSSDRFPQMMPAFGRWRNPRGGQEAARVAPPAAEPLAVALACWLLGSVFLAFVIARSSSAHVFSARYEVFVVPALCLLVALGVSLLRQRWARAALTLGVLAVALVQLPLFYARPPLQDLRTTTHWLTQNYRSGDGMVCQFSSIFPQCRDLIFTYYLYYYHADAIDAGAITAPSDTASLQATATYAQTHARLFFVAGNFGTAADAAKAAATQCWLDSHYALIAQSTSLGSSVRLYATGFVSTKSGGNCPTP